MTAKRKRRGKERLLERSRAIFAERGFHATGIDDLVADAGVAKMTLYNNFPSKEALIEAVLRLTSDRVMIWLERELDVRPGGPGEKLLSVFDIFEAWFASPGFHGCLFSRASREYPDMDHPVHIAAHDHLKRLFSWLEDLADNAGSRDAAMLAQHLLLLLQGATTVMEISGATIAARRAKAVAERLIAARP